MPVVERPELPGILLGSFDELSLVLAWQVAHRPFSLCGIKRGPAEAGYEFGTSVLPIIGVKSMLAAP